LLPATVLGFLAGCSGSLDPGYSSDFIYPSRKDPLVLSPLPADEPVRAIPPGQLEESIRKLPEIKGKLLDPTNLSEADREAIHKALEERFGKPAAPTVKLVGKIEDDDIAELFGDDPNAHLVPLKLADDKFLAEGGKLFRRHCMHCHGVSGDGRGASGIWLSPTPRDFRQGVFKFISCNPTLNRLRPRRDDIRRTVITGIEGTAMPPFGILRSEEIDQLVSYILHLSLRGEVEYDTIKTLLDPSLGRDALAGKQIGAHTTARLALYLAQWSRATTQTGATPMEDAKATDPDEAKFIESVQRGYAIFTGPNAGCVACHQDFGRQARFRYDDWGTVVRPNNLTAGVYRGGRRPIDFYYRLRCGIPGANMPKLDPGLFPDEDVWALINFVRAAPYPEMLPPDIKEKVYGKVAPRKEGHHE
jgi:mono/diheme cytochrome c family protein